MQVYSLGLPDYQISQTLQGRAVIRYTEGVSIRYTEGASIRYRASRIFRKRGGYKVQPNFFGNFFRFFPIKPKPNFEGTSLEVNSFFFQSNI